MTHEFIGNKVLNLSAMTTAEWKQATWFDSFSIAGSVQYHLMSIAEWSPHASSVWGSCNEQGREELS